MMRKGTKRFTVSDFNPDLAFRNKRIMEGSSFDANRAEPSQEQSAHTPPLDAQQAASSRQHVRALNSQFASWVQTQLKNHPDELWEDGVRDYLAHVSNIMKKFSDVVNWLKVNAAKGENLAAAGSCTTAEKKMVPESTNSEKFSQAKTLFSTGSSFAPSWSSGVFSNSQSSAGVFTSNHCSTGEYSIVQSSTGVSSNSQSSSGVFNSQSSPPTWSSGVYSNSQSSEGVFSNNHGSRGGNATGNYTWDAPPGVLTSQSSVVFSTSGISSNSQSSRVFSNSQISGVFSNIQSSAAFSNTPSFGSFSNSQISGLSSNGQSSAAFPNTSSFGLFSNSQSSGLSSYSQPTALFGIQSSIPTRSDASDEADVENDLEQPSSPSVKKSEEKGIVMVHEVKCKLYVKSTETSFWFSKYEVYEDVIIDPADKDAWKDEGTGQLSIRCKEGVSKGTKESKPTIIVWNDVGKVQLNALLYSGIKTNLQKNSLVAIFHTAGEGDGNDGNNNSVVAHTFSIRLKTVEDRDKLATAIQEYAPAS